jgi:hypothetical protein
MAESAIGVARSLRIIRIGMMKRIRSHRIEMLELVVYRITHGRQT